MTDLASATACSSRNRLPRNGSCKFESRSQSTPSENGPCKDEESLLRALQAWLRGDRRACSFVRVPGVQEEDARRPHRELARLTKERAGHVNRIKGLSCVAWHSRLSAAPARSARSTSGAADRLRTAARGSSARHGNAVACISCAMRWPTCQRRRRRLLPPRSARPSSSPTGRRRARSGGTSPISCGPGSRNSAG